MLCHRLRQFREYNNLDCKLVAEVLGITEAEYKDFESNKNTPDIDTITKLAVFYKVTVKEFYGNTPRITLHSSKQEMQFDDVDEAILKMSDLSWDEARIILFYRSMTEGKEDIIRQILQNEQNTEK